MDIYLIRHGQTDWNAEHRLQGQADVALNAKGREQAERARQQILDWGIAFDRVYSSPLSRAFDTAVTVSGFSPEDVRTDDRLKEISFGDGVEGFIYEKMPPAFHEYVADPWKNKPYPGMERVTDLIVRLSSFMKDLAAELTAAPPGEHGNVLVATHGTALHAILISISGKGRAMWDEPLGNCVMFRSELAGGEYAEPVRLTDRTPTFE